MSKSATWDSTTKPILVLTLSSLVVSLLLALVNSFTAPVIEANQKAVTLAAYVQVLPTVSDATELEEITGYTTAGVTGAVKAPDGSIAIQAGESGFDGGVVTVIVGFDTTGTVSGVWADASTQTAGIGDVAAGEDYLGQYTGIANEAGLDGVDTVAGSTQSTVGVKKAVRKCVQAIALLNPNAGTGETAASDAASVPADSAASSAATTGEAASVPAASASSAS